MHQMQSLILQMQSLIHALLSAQLLKYRYGRIFNTLKANYGDSKKFQEDFCEFLFDWVKEESRQLSRQPLPHNLELADIENFSYQDLFADLRSEAPIFHCAVSGALATHYSYHQVGLFHRLFRLTHPKDPWRHPFGGRDISRRISLQSTVCQVVIGTPLQVVHTLKSDYVCCPLRQSAQDQGIGADYERHLLYSSSRGHHHHKVPERPRPGRQVVWLYTCSIFMLNWLQSFPPLDQEHHHVNLSENITS